MRKGWVEAQETLTVAVRGIQAGGYDISRCLGGDAVVLVPEPENAYDHNAVKVLSLGGGMLGYVPADYAAVIDAKDWQATITAVLPHPRTGVPAGLRLTLKRRAAR